MFQMHPLTLEALTKMRQEDYLREAEQHRRAMAAERGSKHAIGAGSGHRREVSPGAHPHTGGSSPRPQPVARAVSRDTG
jgi:hypothetical protein